MKKRKPAVTKTRGETTLHARVRELILLARQTAASTVNTLQVLTNYEIGRRRAPRKTPQWVCSCASRRKTPW